MLWQQNITDIQHFTLDIKHTTTSWSDLLIRSYSTATHLTWGNMAFSSSKNLEVPLIAIWEHLCCQFRGLAYYKIFPFTLHPISALPRTMKKSPMLLLQQLKRYSTIFCSRCSKISFFLTTLSLSLDLHILIYSFLSEKGRQQSIYLEYLPGFLKVKW